MTSVRPLSTVSEQTNGADTVTQPASRIRGSTGLGQGTGVRSHRNEWRFLFSVKKTSKVNQGHGGTAL